MLEALGNLARECRPDLSGPVSILQSRFNRAQASDIQETNRVVRLAKAHTDLALPVCKIPVDQICFVSYGMPAVGIHVLNKHNMALLAGLAAPVTLLSWRCNRVKGVQPVPLQRRPWVCLRRLHKVTGHVHSGVKWCWAWVCVNGENEKMCLSIAHWFEGQLRSFTQRNNRPQWGEGVLLFWQWSEKTYPDQGCSCGGLMEKRKWQTPWPSSRWWRPATGYAPPSIHGVGRSPWDHGCQTSRKERAWKGTESQVTIEVAGACGRNVDTCDTDANRDLKWNPVLTLQPCHVAQPSGWRASLRDQCFFCLEHILWSFCYSLGFGTTAVSGDSRDKVDVLIVVPLQTSVIRFAHAPFTVLLSCSRVCPVLYLPSPILTTLSTLHKCNIHILLKLSTITAVAERRLVVERGSVHWKDERWIWRRWAGVYSSGCWTQ